MITWLKKWFGSEEKNDELIELREDLNTAHSRIEFLVRTNDANAGNIAVLTRRIVALESQYAEFTMTPKEKLLQLRNGLKYLTDFANELQKEIEK